MSEQHTNAEELAGPDPLDQDLYYPLEVFTDEEAAALFEAIAQRNLGISGNEFRKRWFSGYYNDDPDRPEIMDVVMSLPLVVRNKKGVDVR